jgi:hypothetical protein
MTNETRNVLDIVYREDLYPRIKHDPALVQRYAENLEVKIRHGVAMLYSGDLWIGAIYDGMVRFSNHHTEFCESVYHQWLDSVPVEASVTESEFRDKIAGKLSDDGWTVAKEQYTPKGRIDIFAERGNDKRIVEVKLSNKSNDISHALGQLLFYARFYTDASLWICCYQTIDSETESILNFYGVHVLEVK